MSSVCRNLKTEYEALKTLNNEFVLACGKLKEQVGEYENLSVQELHDVQTQKQVLERARDAFEAKLETTEHKTWKSISDTVLSSVAEDGPYKAKSVKELIATKDFRDSIVRNTTRLAEEGHSSMSIVWIASVNVYNAFRSDLLTVEERKHLQEVIETEEFRKILVKTIQHLIDNTMEDARPALKAAHAAVGLGILSKKDTQEIQRKLQTGAFQSKLASELLSCTRSVSIDSQAYWRVVTALSRVYDLGLLEKKDKKDLLKQVGREEFQDGFIEQVVVFATQGQDNGVSACDAIDAVTAMKDLIELTRIRRK